MKETRPIDLINIRSFFRYFYGSKFNKGNAIKSRMPKMYAPILKDLERSIDAWMQKWKDFKQE